MNPLYKWIAIAAATIAILGGIYLKGRSDGKQTQIELQAAAEAKARIAAAAKEHSDRAISASIDAERLAERRNTQDRVRALEADLRAAVRPVVRRMSSCAGGSVSSVAAAPDNLDAGTSRDRPSTGNEVDIAADLAQYAGRCETDRLALISWQRWASETLGAEPIP